MGREKHAVRARLVRKFTRALIAGAFHCECQLPSLKDLHRVLTKTLDTPKETVDDSEPEILFQSLTRNRPKVKKVEVLPKDFKLIIKPPREPEIIFLE